MRAEKEDIKTEHERVANLEDEVRQLFKQDTKVEDLHQASLCRSKNLTDAGSRGTKCCSERGTG